MYKRNTCLTYWFWEHLAILLIDLTWLIDEFVPQLVEPVSQPEKDERQSSMSHLSSNGLTHMFQVYLKTLYQIDTILSQVV